MFKARLLATLFVCSVPFSQAKAADNRQVAAQYGVYTHGIHVLNAVADYRLTDWGYGITTTIHAGGFLNWFLKMELRSTSEGRFENGRVAPIRFQSGGFSRGKNRNVTITYQGDTPTVTELTPPEPDREPVPASELSHSIDTLSAMALLLDTVQRTGHCNGSAMVFDGLRLTAMDAHGPTQSDVPTGSDEIFKGPALKCDFIGQQKAGFMKSSSHLAAMKAPHPGAAWFQDLPGIGLVAVRIEFEHPKLGKMVVVLQDKPRIY
ncbi:DUF3108 domain-containing protein [Kozakia baliensis]|uniref:DUF3108 domain-containing protein n=1 Tax=Kozakia baliensis TaxID=153496 RepID=UPI00087DE0C0|nr:DUF3108 domain-containing protein [Kozakia baliensis]AOX19755.1 hypothetical protein A0U90_05045 [Kozakia baliensis]